jgi:beta-xylosidase
MRSKNIRGPYEEKEVLHNAPGVKEREPNHGAFVQTEAGDWWFVGHQSRGGCEGRPAHLLPVTWKDGWPVPGVVDATGAGNIMWSAPKPVSGHPILVPQSDDEFSAPELGPQWEWNFQPRADKWSLAARPGFLRLHAFKPVRKGNFFKAGNTLTQRVMGYEGGEVTLKVHAWGMVDGQKAGLCLYWNDACRLGVLQQAGVQTVELVNGGTTTPGPALKSPVVWLKALLDDQGGATFAFSLDGKRFTPIGDGYKLGWHNHRGTRIGIYSYNDEADAGYVDVDSFQYRFSGPHQAAGGTPSPVSTK